VLATVVTVIDPAGQVVARVIVRPQEGQRTAEVSVPFFARGYEVRVYTVNSTGVSRGGFATSPLVHTSTLRPKSTRARGFVGRSVAKPVYFAGGSYVLDAQDRRHLRKVARAARASKARLLVTGFARKGANTDAVLKHLSTQRARAVAEFLGSKGVRVWIRYWGAGSMRGDGTATDRRVEIRSLDRMNKPRSRTQATTNPADRGA